MESVYFSPNMEFAEKADRLFIAEREKIAAVIPGADIQHVGGTAIPDLLTKGDLDINVRVSETQFNNAVATLKNLYEIHQPENWSHTFASFKNDHSYDLPLGVQLTVIGAKGDHFVRHRDRLLKEPGLVQELNTLKNGFEGKGMDKYRAAKQIFLRRLDD